MLADDIFAEQKAAGLKRKPIKAWGKDVWAWELCEADRSEFEASRIDYSKPKKPKINYRGNRGRLIVLALYESGADDAKRVFQEADGLKLLKFGGAEMDRVYLECARISGITAGEDDEEESAAAKNSVAPATDSSSA